MIREIRDVRDRLIKIVKIETAQWTNTFEFLAVRCRSLTSYFALLFKSRPVARDGQPMILDGVAPHQGVHAR